MEFEIWESGYLDQGMEGVPAKARLLDKIEANSFDDAVDKYAAKQRVGWLRADTMLRSQKPIHTIIQIGNG